MTDLSSLNSQFQRASRAAGLMDQLVEELRAGGEDLPDDARQRRHDLGRYLATTAGLIDPAWAGQVDPEFADAVPVGLVVTLGEQASRSPELPARLVQIADELKANHHLEASEVELVDLVARTATVGALELSQEILTP